MKMLTVAYVDLQVDHEKKQTLELIHYLLTKDHNDMNYMLLTDLLSEYLLVN